MNCQDAPQVTQLTSTTVCSRHSKCGWDVADPQTEVYTGATAPGPSHCFCLDSIFDSQPLEACLITGLGHCWAGNNCCDSQCSDQNPDNVDTRCAIGHCTPAFQVADHLFPGNRHPSHNSAYLLDWFGKVPRKDQKLPTVRRAKSWPAHSQCRRGMSRQTVCAHSLRTTRSLSCTAWSNKCCY